MTRRLLLDTQAFILAAQDENTLPAKSRNALLHEENAVFLSLVSLWEMQIKMGLKKLKLPVSLPQAVQRAVTNLGMEILPLQAEHIYTLHELPSYHRDPFDRLLIAQALYEDMKIVGNDAIFDTYKCQRLWK